MNEKNKSPLRDRVPPSRWGSNEYWEEVTGTIPGKYDELIKYAQFRANGYDKFYSFNAAFGFSEDGYSTEVIQRARAMETTEEYRRHYNFALGALIPDKKAIENLAVTVLLEIVRSDGVTAAVRSKTVETLCTLVGITEIGEDGKTRKVGQMSDFYKDIGTEQTRGRNQDSFNALPSPDGAADDKKSKH